MAFFVPPMGLDNDEDLSRDQQYLIQQYLQAAAEREQEQKETEQVAETNADNKEGGTGTRAKGEEGSMGNPNTKETGHRFGIQGPQDNPDPHIARQAALREAAEFGMIGLLNTGAGGDPNAPTAPWGRDDSLGNDPMSARGNMWGDSIGDSFGAGGLGLSGIGEGGGGRGEGIGLGSIGTIGHGAGTGTGQGFGSGHGRLGGSHSTRAPQVRMGATTVNGRLPPEVIQRIVRQNFGRFRLCYEDGLRKNPTLQGRVAIKFVIDRGGRERDFHDRGDTHVRWQEIRRGRGPDRGRALIRRTLDHRSGTGGVDAERPKHRGAPDARGHGGACQRPEVVRARFGLEHPIDEIDEGVDRLDL